MHPTIIETDKRCILRRLRELVAKRTSLEMLGEVPLRVNRFVCHTGGCTGQEVLPATR